MTDPQIYTYSSFGEFFAAYVQTRKDADPGFSLRALAKRLHVRSPSLLAMVARGEREPTPAVLHRLCEHLGFDAAAVRYAELLVGLRRAKDIKEQLRCARELRRLTPANSELVLELGTLEMIAKWYFHVILEMACLPEFREDPAWISRRLGATVSPDMAAEALATLVQHGVLSRGPDGRLRKAAEVVRTSVNVPSTAIRSGHKQVLMRAHAAIDRQPVDERYFTSVTLLVPKANVAQAGKLISQFRDEFMKTITEGAEEPHEVYHLAVQFFRATERPAAEPSGART